MLMNADLKEMSPSVSVAPQEVVADVLPSCVLCSPAQEQYQYLYKAMLSLVGNREFCLSPVHMDTNGVVVMADESDPAESMESLV